MSVRTRIAPSPTGDPHVGTAYIAVFNYIFAKHHKGKFILRIEDTDASRCHPEYEKNIFDALKWCHIPWDEGPDIGGKLGPYRQSERLDIYQEWVNKLLDKGLAYKCFCSADELAEVRMLQMKTGKWLGYDRRCRNLSPEEINKKLEAKLPYTIRLKVPLSGDCVFEDAVKKRITVPWKNIDDQVLMKSDGFPTYHLANVVDDCLMEITHVIRGDEWISSTPKHVLLYQYFEKPLPVFMHLPLLLDSQGKKLSKRKNPTSIFFYRDSGFIPEAFVNFLTLMAYSMPNDLEIYSLDKVIKEFDPKRLGVSGAIFNLQKLEWLNQHYILNFIPQEKLWDRIKEWGFQEKFMKSLIPLCHSRLKTFADFIKLTDFFFINHLPYSQGLFAVKGISSQQAAYILQGVLWWMEKERVWSSDAIKEAVKEVASIFGVNLKKCVMPLLFAAIMGKKQGLPLFGSVQVLGKDRTRARFLMSIEFLGGISNKKLSSLKKAWDKRDCSEFMKEEESG